MQWPHKVADAEGSGLAQRWQRGPAAPKNCATQSAHKVSSLAAPHSAHDVGSKQQIAR